jgi:hypothetical protein
LVTEVSLSLITVKNVMVKTRTIGQVMCL